MDTIKEQCCMASRCRALGPLTLLMAIIAMASYATLNFYKVDFLNPTPATISVSGEGEVMAVPDVGQFSFAVKAEAEDAATAQEESGLKINEIISYLKEQGIEDKDIKTQNYNLYPTYRYEDKICPVGTYCPRERVEDGFEVSQTVQVKVRNTDDSGKIIAVLYDDCRSIFNGGYVGSRKSSTARGIR